MPLLSASFSTIIIKFWLLHEKCHSLGISKVSSYDLIFPVNFFLLSSPVSLYFGIISVTIQQQPPHPQDDWTDHQAKNWLKVDAAVVSSHHSCLIQMHRIMIVDVVLCSCLSEGDEDTLQKQQTELGIEHINKTYNWDGNVTQHFHLMCYCYCSFACFSSIISSHIVSVLFSHQYVEATEKPWGIQQLEKKCNLDTFLILWRENNKKIESLTTIHLYPLESPTRCC